MIIFKLQNKKIIFNPDISVAKIFLRKILAVVGWIFVLILIAIGLYGIAALGSGSARVFAASLIADAFLIYLWSYKKENGAEIDVAHFGEMRDEDFLNIYMFLDRNVRRSLEKAWSFCYQKNHRQVRSIHLLYYFFKAKEIKKTLKRLDCDIDVAAEKTKKILQEAAKIADQNENEQEVLEISPELQESFYEAYLFCLKRGKKKIGILEVLWVMSRQENLVWMIFEEFGISHDEIEMAIKWVGWEEEIERREKYFFWRKPFKPRGRLNRAMTAASTPILNKVGEDLTFMVRQGEFEMAVGRDKEISEIFNLFAAGQTGIVLVGSGDVGKKTILRRMAQLMVEENVPRFLRDKRLVKLDFSDIAFLSGSTEKGEEQFKRILYEVNRAGNVILVIENVDNLVGMRTHAGGMDFAEILASALEKKAFRLLATATVTGFAAKIEGRSLDRALSAVEVGAPSRELLWNILVVKAYFVEKELGVLFSVDAIDELINLADRYFYGATLSSKAIELLNEAGFWVKSRRDKNRFISGDDITDLVSKKVGIPLGEVSEGEKEKLLDLENIIHRGLIDQEEAVGAVADALRRNRIYLQQLKRPICNLLFVGPTGVGKTQLAKTLAQTYFGDAKRMIRLDMSEYQEKRSLRRLIGMRSDEGIQKGHLTEAVKRQPHSLLLLDEIEKAHPDILNLFLQVLDDGRLTDASDETINFTNMIIIATSNAGTHFVQSKLKEGMPYEEVRKQMQEEVLLEHFSPEFLNRFDKIVLFKSLSLENLVEIARLMIKEINERMEEQGITVEVEEEAMVELSQKGFNPIYGARSLRRVVQEIIENTLARMILENKISRRDKLIVKKGLVFEVKKSPIL